MKKIHRAFGADAARMDVFPAAVAACGVFANDPFFKRTHLATGDKAQVTCKYCLGTHARLGRKLQKGRPASHQELRAAIRVIYQAVRGDEKSEYWTLRKFLDRRHVFHDDLQDGDRLIEAVCKCALRLP